MTLDELTSLANHKWIAYYTANPVINQKRQDIAASMPDWGNDWYSNPVGLQQLYYFLDDLALLFTRDQNRRDLLDELDFDELQDAAGEFAPLPAGEEAEEINDPARLTWFTTLADEVYLSLRYSDPEWSEPYGMWYRYDQESGFYEWNENPEKTPRAWISQEEADALIVARAPQPGRQDMEPDRYAGPEWSGPYGMYYRYDRQRGLYEWNRDPWLTPGAWISQKQADALISSQAHQPPGVDQAEYSRPAWDENWQMYYRLTREGVYQYSRSSDGTGTGQPTQWLSYAEAKEARSQAAAPPEAETGSAGPPVKSLAEAEAAVADTGLAALRQASAQVPEIAGLLAQLPPEERHRVLGQAMADGAEAAGVLAAAA